ncbi:hypothetical protein KY285_012243 [Solanum tuberosum]|nr:hypothetical protein KY289_012767 [Solanum tuberosum]KAH0736536.1 hypothetical protein KY285_012243 [Solanum tuberosum]
MDKGDVEMLDAEKNVPASDVLVSNESPVKYENGVKTGKSNAEDKKDDHKAHDNVVLENKPPTIDAGMDYMVSGYVKVINDELQNIEKMIYEVNQNGNDLMVDRQEDSQMKTIPTNVITDSFIGKMPEPASPMFPSTANARHYSGEASENICAMMADGKDDEGSPEDQAAFIGKLGTFYREKAMELKLPKFYGHSLNCLKLWRSVIKLGGYDRGSGYQSSASGRVVRDSAARCRLGWQEQHLLGYGEVAEPIVKDRNANNMPKHAKSLKNSGKIVRQFFANSYISIIELLSPHHFPI